jgi:hypothetical protein
MIGSNEWTETEKYPVNSVIDAEMEVLWLSSEVETIADGDNSPQFRKQRIFHEF